MTETYSNAGLFEGEGVNVLTANYIKRLRHLTYYCLIWTLFAVFTYLFLFSSVLETVQFMENAMSVVGEFRFLLMMMAALLLFLLVVDILWVALAVNSGKPALKIDGIGIHGFTGGSWRSISWDRVESISQGALHLVIARAPRNGFHAYIRRVNSASRGAFLGHYEICIPFRRIDKNLSEIYGMVERYRPDLTLQYP